VSRRPEAAVVGAGRGRIPYLDNAKVQLIAIVVFTHLFELVLRIDQPGQSFYRLILLFHMPAFVFITGYLAKPDLLTSKGRRSLAWLLWAFLLANSLNHLWSVWAEGAQLDLMRIIARPYFALWFLQAMIWWRILLMLFGRGASKRAALVSIAAAAVAAAASGYFLTDGAQFSLSRTFFFLPFYVAGFRAAQQRWRVPRTLLTRIVAFAAFALVFTALYWGGAIRDNELLYGRQTYAQMGHLTATSGIMRLALLGVSAVLVTAFMQFVPRRKLIFSVLGATTISVYVWHAFSIRLIRFFDQREFFAGNLSAVLVWTAVALVVFGIGPFARTTMRVLTGRKA